METEFCLSTPEPFAGQPDRPAYGRTQARMKTRPRFGAGALRGTSAREQRGRASPGRFRARACCRTAKWRPIAVAPPEGHLSAPCAPDAVGLQPPFTGRAAVSQEVMLENWRTERDCGRTFSGLDGSLLGFLSKEFKGLFILTGEAAHPYRGQHVEICRIIGRIFG